jgi:hypothetical protein
VSTKQGPNPKTEQVTSVRLSPDEHAAFKEIAEREHRSLSGQVRHWIKAQLDAEKRRAA